MKKVEQIAEAIILCVSGWIAWFLILKIIM